MKEISPDFENGTHALHIQQNEKVFQALQKSFLTIEIDFKGLNKINSKVFIAKLGLGLRVKLRETNFCGPF